MRIGEIAIVSPHEEENRRFIRALADTVEVESEQLAFGKLDINKQLTLHLYGITLRDLNSAVSWDLLSQKLLGFIAIFRWGETDSFRRVQKIVDYLTSKYDTSIVVVGQSKKKTPLLPAGFAAGVPIERSGLFTFCNVDNPAEAKRVLLTLIDNIIDRLN